MCYYIGGVSELNSKYGFSLLDASGPDGERSPWKWQS